jgi:hypothetical protein
MFKDFKQEEIIDLLGRVFYATRKKYSFSARQRPEYIELLFGNAKNIRGRINLPNPTSLQQIYDALYSEIQQAEYLYNLRCQEDDLDDDL